MSKKLFTINFTDEIILGLPDLISEVTIALIYLSASYLRNLNKVAKNGKITRVIRVILRNFILID